MSLIPIMVSDVARAEDAWEAHKALIKAEVACPALADNPVWLCLRMDAYEAFVCAFEVAP